MYTGFFKWLSWLTLLNKMSNQLSHINPLSHICPLSDYSEKNSWPSWIDFDERNAKSASYSQVPLWAKNVHLIISGVSQQK